MFVLQLLQHMKVKVKLPIIVHFDNVDMTNNMTTTGLAKCVDTCYKFITEYVEDGII